MDTIINEYRHYAGAKARALDEKYISEFDQYGMGMRLTDAVYRLAKETTGLLTPPPSDKSYTDGNCKETDPRLQTHNALDLTAKIPFSLQ